MNGKIGLRIVSALVLLAALASAFFLFRQVSPKARQSPLRHPRVRLRPCCLITVTDSACLSSVTLVLAWAALGPILGFFLIVLALKSFRMLVWGPRWGHMGHHGGHGPWGRHWENGVPPMFEEWHKKAHNIPEGAANLPEDKKE